ncbi:hypothetical protein [Photobacterium leiognathi]|uniref:hypothetical protein n=1 Tax=Photobacterium leiognathi TaxID=553611 RepID=UPI0029819A55|nr:hypothetical protein [Photobacterium leiognathi]
MKYIRDYVNSPSFQNFRVRKAIASDADHVSIIKFTDEHLLVTSVISDEKELESGVVKPLYADVTAFKWLRSNATQKGCVAIWITDGEAILNDPKGEISLATATMVAVKDNVIEADLSGRLDAVLATALRYCQRLELPLVINKYHVWDGLYSFIESQDLNVDVELVSDQFTDGELKEFTPIPVADAYAEYHRTGMEKLFIASVTALVLGSSFLGYTAYETAKLERQREIVHRVVEDPFKAYRNEIKGAHVTQDVNFVISKIGEYNSIPSWDVSTSEIKGRKFKMTFSPKYVGASVTELVQWVRANTKDKLTIKGAVYSVELTIPKYKDDYMSAFKRYIIDTELNYAQLNDLALYSGFSKVTLQGNAAKSNYRVMTGQITGVRLDLTQIKAFYDQLAHVPVESVGLTIKLNKEQGNYNITQKYKLTGQLDHEQAKEEK